MLMPDEITYESVLAYDGFGADAINALELGLLRKLLLHARDTVPFWEKTFDQIKFDPDSLSCVNDILRLPLLDKGMILCDPDAFVSRSFDENSLKVVQTGGSTGEPFRVLTTTNDSLIQNAFNWAQWHRLGIQPGGNVVALTGLAHKHSPEKTIVNPARKDGLMWVHRPSFDLAPDWRGIIATIRQHKPVLIRGFPSIVSEMAQAMLELGEQPFASVKGVSLSSEDILSDQRRIIERAFAVRCHGFYGQSEHCVLAMDCGKSRSYHLYPGYAHVEIVDEYGMPITAPGVIGEVVGTSLLNYAMPLIRYRTGDMAAWDSGAIECACGRQHRRISMLAGRKRNRVFLPDGRSIFFGSDVYDEIWYSPEIFKQIQFMQESPERLEIRIVPFPKTDQKQLANFVVESMRKALGNELSYEVRFVCEVERTSRGKYLLFIQKMAH